jgi:hypothetical protein
MEPKMHTIEQCLAEAMLVQSADDGRWWTADIIADAWEDTCLDMDVMVTLWRTEADRRNREEKAIMADAICRGW